MSEDLKTVKVVYGGQRKMSGGKTGHFYYNLDESPWGGFAKSLTSTKAKIGSLIEARVNAEDRVVVAGPNAPQIIGTAGLPAATIASWELTTEVLRVEDARAATERRLVRESSQPMEEAIETLRAALEKLPYRSRIAAVQYITSRLY